MRAGCRYYFGYPITPQNEVPEYMSGRLLEVGGTFVQAESELASINMVIGAAMAGARVMTTSSSPGISLMQEGISYLAGLELPAVIANVVRGGPGLGNIAPAQSDYFQATRGGGHGDYRTIVLAPASCQELCDLTVKAFDLADKYRNPVMIMGDGMMGQMMEPVEFPEMTDLADLPAKDWTITGAQGRPSRALFSLLLTPKVLEDHNYKLVRKYDAVTRSGDRLGGVPPGGRPPGGGGLRHRGAHRQGRHQAGAGHGPEGGPAQAQDPVALPQRAHQAAHPHRAPAAGV